MCESLQRGQKNKRNVEISGKRREDKERGKKRSISLLHCYAVVHLYTYYNLNIQKQRKKKLVKTSTGVIIRQTSELYYRHTETQFTLPPRTKHISLPFFLSLFHGCEINDVHSVKYPTDAVSLFTPSTPCSLP